MLSLLLNLNPHAVFLYNTHIGALTSSIHTLLVMYTCFHYEMYEQYSITLVF